MLQQIPPFTRSFCERFFPGAPTVLLASLLAALPGLAQAACTASRTAVLTREDCTAGGVQYFGGAGSVVLTVNDFGITGGGVQLGPSPPDQAGDTTGGPYDQTLSLTGTTTIDNPGYSGVIMQSHKAGRKVTVTAESSVTIVSGGGFGAIWVRNDTSGDIDITSAATLTSANDVGINATTNFGAVSVGNAGRVISSAFRGLYADGGFNNDPGSPVVVGILNEVGGWVTAFEAGARSINYHGLSKIENRGKVESTTRQALVAWSNDGPATIVNSGTVTAADDHAIQAATEFGDVTVTNSGSVTANDNPDISVVRSGYAAIFAEVDLDTVTTPGANGAVSVTNLATGQVSAPDDYAIYAASPQGSVTVTNAGTASGLHGIWANAVDGAVSVTNSGTVTANGSAGIGVRIAAASSGTVENSGTISSADVGVQVDAGTQLTQVNNLSTGTIRGRLLIAGATAVQNGGTLELPASGMSSVGGSYTQSHGGHAGALRIRVGSAVQFGKLSVTGNAVLPAGATIEVRTDDQAGCASIAAGATLAGVVSAGALTSGDITVTDDCANLNFTAVRNGQAIDLVSVQPVPGVCGSAADTPTAFSPAANLCTAGVASAVTSGSPWTWTCQGSGGGGNAMCSAPNASVLGGGGGGLARADVTSPVGNTNAWVVDTAASRGFISTTDPAAPPTLPPGVTFPLGLFDVKLVTGDAGSQAVLQITYPNPLPAGAAWWKYGRTAANPTPHWYRYSGAVLSDNTVTLTLTDGGQGDDDLTVNSTIVDPGGVGVSAAVTAIPTLSAWGMALLSALLGLVGWIHARRRSV